MRNSLVLLFPLFRGCISAQVHVPTALSTSAPAFLGELKVIPLETLALQPADVGKHFSALLRDEPEHQVRLQ